MVTFEVEGTDGIGVYSNGRRFASITRHALFCVAPISIREVVSLSVADLKQIAEKVEGATISLDHELADTGLSTTTYDLLWKQDVSTVRKLVSKTRDEILGILEGNRGCLRNVDHWLLWHCLSLKAP